MGLLPLYNYGTADNIAGNFKQKNTVIMKKNLLVLLLAVFTLHMSSAQTGSLKSSMADSLVISTDDCEQENDAIDTPYDDDLDAGWEGEEGDANVLTTGLRFRDITIAQGATIDSAFIIVHSHEGKDADDVANITIWAEATDNAETFNETDLITDRTSTSATVDWTVDYEWIIWEPYSTPNLASIVQEIVDRAGWESGNAIAFVMQGEDQGPSTVENAREFESFENISDPEDVDPDGNPGDGQNHPERVPMLKVYYNGGTTPFEIAIQATGKIAIEEETSVRNISYKPLSVYPNPVADNNMKISLENSNRSEISIYNSNGVLINTFSKTQQEVNIDISELSSGIYFINVIQNNALYSGKVVKL